MDKYIRKELPTCEHGIRTVAGYYELEEDIGSCGEAAIAVWIIDNMPFYACELHDSRMQREEEYEEE